MLQPLTGCPKQEKTIPPMVAETITTTKSEINLQAHNVVRLKLKSQKIDKSMKNLTIFIHYMSSFCHLMIRYIVFIKIISLSLNQVDKP